MAYREQLSTQPATWLAWGAVGLVGLSPALGCASSGGAPPAQSANQATDEERAAEEGLVEHHRFHHYGGVTLFVAMSLETLGVAPEQRSAIAKIRGELESHMEPARASERALEGVLAEGVAAGAVDRARVDAAVAQCTTAASTVDDESVGALDALHAGLTAEERVALVGKVESHWAVWRNANLNATESSEWASLGSPASELDLSPEQTKQANVAVRQEMQGVVKLDPAAVDAYLKQFGDAFVGATFSANALLPAGAVNERFAHWGEARLAHVVIAVAPLLAADQRERLVQRLREHASHQAGSPEASR